MLSRIIYTTVDSLYDTKLTLISLVDSRLSREYFVNEYNTKDYIGYLSPGVINDLFKTRTKDVLLGSKNSSVIHLIRQISRDFDLRSNLDIEAEPSKTVLHINVAPYELSTEEKENIKNFFSTKIPFLSEVVIVDEITLTDKYVSSLTIMVDRYGLDWFMARKLENPSLRYHKLRLIVPDKIYNEQGISKMKVDRDKMFRYIETSLAQDVKLEFIEEELFKLQIDELK